jgi:hypothetical protein
MEIVGTHPTIEILQQPAEELAAAERLSKQIVRAARKKRAVRASVSSGAALLAFAMAGILGYFWLLQGGEIRIADVIRDSSNIAIGALVSTVVALAGGVVGSAYAYRQKDPTDAEAINCQRLRTIATRWEELDLLGLPKTEKRELRRRR